MAKKLTTRVRPAKRRPEPQIVEVGVSFEQIVAALTPALLQALPVALASAQRPAPKPDESPPTGGKSLGDAKIVPSLTGHLLESVSGMAGVLSRLRALAGRASHGDEEAAPQGVAQPAPTTHIDLAATVRQQTNIAHDLLDVIERSV